MGPCPRPWAPTNLRVDGRMQERSRQETDRHIDPAVYVPADDLHDPAPARRARNLRGHGRRDDCRVLNYRGRSACVVSRILDRLHRESITGQRRTATICKHTSCRTSSPSLSGRTRTKQLGGPYARRQRSSRQPFHGLRSSWPRRKVLQLEDTIKGSANLRQTRRSPSRRLHGGHDREAVARAYHRRAVGGTDFSLCYP